MVDDGITPRSRPNDDSYVRMKIIKRFGDTWFFLFFWVFAYMLKHNKEENINTDSECFAKLHLLLDLFFYGYIGYACFLAITLIGCVCTSLELPFRFIQMCLSLIFFFGLFLYANFVLYNLPERCTEVTGNLRLFVVLYIIAWYAFLFTRLVMFVFYVAKRLFWAPKHEMEGMQLFIDVE